jgi:putative membrane protein insertion efficiency factor
MKAGAVARRPSPAVRLAVWYIETYRARVSPLLPARCRFQPSCSAYALEAYQKYGFWRGTTKTVWRLLRCHPFRRAAGVYDPP